MEASGANTAEAQVLPANANPTTTAHYEKPPLQAVLPNRAAGAGARHERIDAGDGRSMTCGGESRARHFVRFMLFASCLRIHPHQQEMATRRRQF